MAELNDEPAPSCPECLQASVDPTWTVTQWEKHGATWYKFGPEPICEGHAKYFRSYHRHGAEYKVERAVRDADRTDGPS